MSIAVDASAVLAVLLNEPEAAEYFTKLTEAPVLWISAVNWWEVQVRAARTRGRLGTLTSAAWMEDIGLIIEPVTIDHARVALAAFEKYRGRPARLNMGDCFAYALAKVKDAPLLYKGNDFGHTDVRRA